MGEIEKGIKDVIDDTLRRVEKMNRDIARRISEEHKEEEYVPRKEPDILCPNCGAEFNGYHCYECGYDYYDDDDDDDDYYYPQEEVLTEEEIKQRREWQEQWERERPERERKAREKVAKEERDRKEEERRLKREERNFTIMLTIIIIIAAIISLFWVFPKLSEMDQGKAILEKPGVEAEPEVLEKISPKNETSKRSEAISRREFNRAAQNLNKYLGLVVNSNILPRYRAEIDGNKPYRYFHFNKRGNNIQARVEVPLRVRGNFTYWGNFLCFSSDNGATWKVQWENKYSYKTRALLKPRRGS